MWRQLERRAAEGDNRQHSERRVLGQKEVVTTAHNACIRELLQEVHVHGKAMMMPFNCSDRHMRLLTIETESRLGAANEGPPVPEEQYQERLWRRRLDGIGLDTATKEFLAIEFKRTQDARSNYVERATGCPGADEPKKGSTFWNRAVSRVC